jgi:seryl-tRNA synthetase
MNMLDIRIIRENPEKVKSATAAKNCDPELVTLVLTEDARRREILAEVEQMKATRNSVSKQIGDLKKQKLDAEAPMQEMKALGEKISAYDEELRQVDVRLQDALQRIPNMADESVPAGKSSEDNVVVRTWGTPRTFDFSPVDHKTLGEKLGLFDFERGAKISGSGFPIYTGLGARLERALINWFLDMHTENHGFSEVLPPYLVNRQSMIGTGQLPKMEHDMYRCDKDDDLFLIPTAEVPVTNMLAGETLLEKNLPVKYCAYSACFRREAGSYGKDTRGFLRLHQFDKVEMVQFSTPEESAKTLEQLVGYAEALLQALGLHYRVLALCSGDLSFSAAKCYDLEVWSPVEQKWLEVSSVSNFGDYQARRAGIKVKSGSTTRFLHTLNGSGLATPRVLVALLDHYQNADGSITVPEVLRPYMGNRSTIAAA